VNRPQLVLSSNTRYTARDRIAHLEVDIATFRDENRQEIKRIEERFIVGPLPVRVIRAWLHAPVVDHYRALCDEALAYEERLLEILNLLDAQEPRRAGSRIMDLMQEIENEVSMLLDDHLGQGRYITGREEKAIRLKDIHEKLEAAHETLMNELYAKSKSH
jgi:hypothetical protein